MGVVGDIAGAFIGAKASKKASKAQVALGREALALQERMFNQSRTDLMPWLTAGGQAIGTLGEMLKPGYDYTKSPGYEFRLSEGMRGVENSAAARGLLQSGGTLKGIDRYNQNFAANDFNDQFNRVASVAAGGQQVGTNLGTLGSAMAQNGGNILQGIGNAKASGYIGSANSWINGINNVDARFQQMAQMMGGGG